MFWSSRVSSSQKSPVSEFSLSMLRQISPSSWAGPYRNSPPICFWRFCLIFDYFSHQDIIQGEFQSETNSLIPILNDRINTLFMDFISKKKGGGDWESCCRKGGRQIEIQGFIEYLYPPKTSPSARPFYDKAMVSQPRSAVFCFRMD